MRHHKARSGRELSELIDEFMRITNIRCRKHTIRLLSGKRHEKEHGALR